MYVYAVHIHMYVCVVRMWRNSDLPIICPHLEDLYIGVLIIQNINRES